MQQIIVEGEEDRQPKNVAAEFLRYHQKFNHVSPKKIQAMAKRGMLPRRLANCPVQLCTGIHKTIKWGLIHYGTNERRRRTKSRTSGEYTWGTLVRRGQ
jgi:hypothetical protein